METEKKPIELMIIGAGTRGMISYGKIIKKGDVNVKVVGVADIDPEKVEKMREEYDIPEENCFETGMDALEKDKFCDAVLITTPNWEHYDLTMKALDKGYHVLLEKPMSPDPKECVEIVRKQEKTGKILSIAHVLRYTSFFQKIKEIIDSGELGKMYHIDLLEDVCYWHFAHSFVRGNWRRKEESGPVLLTKSCHDMDILTWLINSDVDSILSFGSLKYFKEKNSPKGSTERCTDDCKIKDKCPFNAEKFYLEEEDPEQVKWPVRGISPMDKTIEARKKALKEGPFGRCVYRCDNDVNDNQEVLIKFSNSVTARFILTSLGSDSTRKIKIFFERGIVHGDFLEGSIRIVTYSGLGKKGNDVHQMDLPYKKGHGGGDEGLLRSFVKSIHEKHHESNITGAKESLQSHLMAFATEESIEKNREIDFQEYKRVLGL